MALDVKLAMQEKIPELQAHCTARQSSFGTSCNVMPHHFYQEATKSNSEPVHPLAICFLYLNKNYSLSFHWCG